MSTTSEGSGSSSRRRRRNERGSPGQKRRGAEGGTTLEQLDAADQVTPRDLATAQDFWIYWGTPLLKALLDAKSGGRKRGTRSSGVPGARGESEPKVSAFATQKARNLSRSRAVLDTFRGKV